MKHRISISITIEDFGVGGSDEHADKTTVTRETCYEEAMHENSELNEALGCQLGEVLQMLHSSDSIVGQGRWRTTVDSLVWWLDTRAPDYKSLENPNL